MATSRPFDLGQLNSRLLEIAADNNKSPRRAWPPLFEQERSPAPPLPSKEEQLEGERRTYNALIKIGGRPCYPIDLLEDVFEDPKKYHDMLACWRTSDTEWRVFRKQLARWQGFRNWQRYVRGILIDDGFSEYADIMKPLVANDPWFARTILSNRQLDEQLKNMWEWSRNGWKLYGAREVGGFPAHVEAVKRRLAQHGFTRSFQLDEDPKRQDRLTTWIEYLNYECWWYERYSREVWRQQPYYDETWRNLADLNVLRPFETANYILSDVWPLRQENEKLCAFNAVKSAEAAAKAVYVSTQTYPSRSNFTKLERMRMLQEAHSGLLAARESLQSIQRRGHLISNFRQTIQHYNMAKKEAERHTILLRWIIEQMPCVEAELKQSKVALDRYDPVHDTKRRLRYGKDDAEAPKGRSPKMQRSHGRANLIWDSSIASDRQMNKKSKLCRHQDAVEDEPPSTRFSLSSESTDSVANVLAIEQTVSRSPKVSENPPPQSVKVLQSSATPQQLLRNNCRTVAHQDPPTAVVPPLDAVEIPSKISRRRLVFAPSRKIGRRRPR